MKLEHLDVFLYDVRGGSILLIANQLLVGLDNIRQFVCQIILKREKKQRCYTSLSLSTSPSLPPPLSYSLPFSLIIYSPPHTHLVFC